MKKIIALCLSLVFCLPLCGCGDSGSILNYSLLADPGNLDPQTATNNDAIEIISNIYNGLLVKDQEGNLVPGMADSYEVSEDGLMYTFKIREGQTWKYYNSSNAYDGEEIVAQVTADDFVFALQRVVDPATASAYASNFYCIQNAAQVSSGALPVDHLGVQAVNESTLVIQLAYQNPFFLESLASTAASPCNRAFFETVTGQYGLSRDKILCNGPFYLTEWAPTADDPYVKIRKNPNYYAAADTSIGGVNFTVYGQENIVSAVDKGDVNVAVLSDAQYQNSNQGKYQAMSFSNTVFGLSFQTQETHASNANLRKALMLDINREDCKSYYPTGAQDATAIVPPSITLLDENYREMVGSDFCFGYDPVQAQQLWNAALAQLAKKGITASDINTLTLLVPQGSENLAERILQVWQKDLNVYIQLDAQPWDQYQKRLKTGEYSCALVPLSSTQDSPASVLSCFESANANNISKYSATGYDKLMTQAQQQTDLTVMAQQYAQAEQMVMNDAVFLPLYYQAKYLITPKNIQNIGFDPASQLVYFHSATE